VRDPAAALYDPGPGRSTSRGMTSDETAADWAAAELARVSDDPSGRMALLARTYKRGLVRSPRQEPFSRAATSFMRWQAARGVLRPLDADPPGSRWWRAVNGRLLLDSLEATARANGLGGEATSQTIAPWTSFIDKPTPQTWYRAHNITIVSAYLEHRELAELESEAERFFVNVALARVLYAHALVAAPRLSLGQFGALGPLLGDPRRGMAGAFLSLHRVLPDRYPLEDPVETLLPIENRLGRLLDYGVIVPRLQALYEWSARMLGVPRLLELVREGNPIYAWSYADRHVWVQARASLAMRALRVATYARRVA
jgi:hypothetical protein